MLSGTARSLQPSGIHASPLWTPRLSTRAKPNREPDVTHDHQPLLVWLGLLRTSDLWLFVTLNYYISYVRSIYYLLITTK